MATRSIPLAFLASGFLLASCGGGGSGSSSGSNPDPNTPPLGPEPPTPPISSALAGSSFTDIDFEDPKFGSVFVSGSIGFPQVSDVKTSFDGNYVDLTVSRNDGSRLFIDGSVRTLYAGDDILNLDNFSYDKSEIALWDGYSYFETAIGEVNASQSGARLSAAQISVHHRDNDFTDYIAFGYWIDLKMIYEEPYVSALEIGVFAEGPEFEDDATLPLSGSATYIGDFNGIFAYVDNAQNTQMGNYVGDLELNVDFGTNSIAGYIGLGDRYLYDVGIIDSNGNYSLIREQETDYYISIEPTSFTNNGQIIGDDNLIIRKAGGTATTTDSSWAGKFSSINSNNDIPDAIIGTGWVDFQDSTGIGGIAGAFMAVED